MGRRRILVAMLALSLGLLVRPVAVGSVVACSCAMDADPMLSAARDPAQAIFTGVVQSPVVEGTPVVVTRWFRGPAPQGVVWLDNEGFEDPFAGMCGTPRPPADTEWIFAAWPSERGRFRVDMCSQHAELKTERGQQFLQTATTVLGPPGIPLAQPDQPGSDPAIGGVVAIALGGVALLGLAAGLFLVAGRRRS